MLSFDYRTPRGLSGSLDSNAFARGRAYCEEYRKFVDVFSVVDSLEYDGVSYRTVSGWKHSSTKVILAGVILLKRRLQDSNSSFLYFDR